MAMDALYPQLLSVAADVDALADHGNQWFPKLVGLKVSATETARRWWTWPSGSPGAPAISAAPNWNGCTGTCWPGMFHPSDDESAHNTVANAWLGPARD